MPRYSKEFRTKRGEEAPPAVRDAGKKLLGFLQNQSRISGVTTLSKTLFMGDGTVVTARLVNGNPIVEYEFSARASKKKAEDYYLAATTTVGDSLAVVSLATGRLVEDILLENGIYAYGVAAHPLLPEVWACGSQGKIFIVSMESLEVVSSIDFSDYATSTFGLCFSPDGRFLYAAGSNGPPNATPPGDAIYVFDVAARTRLGAGFVPTGGSTLREPYAMAFNADGTRLFVGSHEDSGTAALAGIFIAVGDGDMNAFMFANLGEPVVFDQFIEPPPGKTSAFSSIIKVNCDHTRLVIGHLGNELFVYDAVTPYAYIGEITSVGISLEHSVGLALHPFNPNIAVVVNRDDALLDLVDISTLAILDTIELYLDPKAPLSNHLGWLLYEVVYHPDADKVYVTNNNGQTIISVGLSTQAFNGIIGELSQPTNPWLGWPETVLLGGPRNLVVAPNTYPNNKS